ncbi:unnamed protein product [Natator depressus]
MREIDQIRGQCGLEDGLKGGSPLHLACFKGCIKIVCLLRDNHAKLNVKGGMDWTPLHVATHYSKESVVCELLRSRVDPNIIEKSELTPLHLAVQQGAFLSTINLLEHKADINVKNKVGWMPLQLAIRNQKQNIATLLQGKDLPVNNMGSRVTWNGEKA